MNTIPIYKTEASDGLAEKISEQKVLSYAVPLEVWKPDSITKAKIVVSPNVLGHLVPSMLQNAKSSVGDVGLYYTKSILVTSNWNKNDDVFLPSEIWPAKATPIHKPTNLEHDEHKLVGHIVDTWAINAEGTLIPDDTVVDELPDIFHIVNGAVIYTLWEDKDLQDRTTALIDSIKSGKKFVSMECVFSNFDYAVIGSDGSSKVIARDGNTAWMTKHLRIYGGKGEYEGSKIGRLLRHLTFSGKGYVDNPANPYSIMLNDGFVFKGSKSTNNLDNGVCNTIGTLNTSATILLGDLNMAEQDIMKTQLDEVKAQLKSALESKASLEDKLAKADVEKLSAQITELTSSVEASKKSAEEFKKMLEDKKAKCEELETQVATLNTSNTELQTQLAQIKIAETKANRISTLVDGGIEKDIATTKVDIFANLNDEQFTVVATELVEAAKVKKDKKPADTSTCADDIVTDKAEVVATDAALDTVVVVPAVDLSSTDADVDPLAETRAELQAAYASHIGKKRPVKKQE